MTTFRNPVDGTYHVVEGRLNRVVCEQLVFNYTGNHMVFILGQMAKGKFEDEIVRLCNSYNKTCTIYYGSFK